MRPVPTSTSIDGAAVLDGAALLPQNWSFVWFLVVSFCEGHNAPEGHVTVRFDMLIV